MRAKPMILILIALGCGLVASIGISQVMDRRGASTRAVEMEKVYVAIKAIDINEKLDAKSVKVEEWPKDRIPQGACIKLEDVKDQYTVQRLYPGEPILKAKLADTQGGAIKHIPDGFTVMSVKVSMDTAVSGLIKPGDHVDVLVYLKKSGEIAQTTTRTILRKIRVFAVNDSMTRETDDEKEKSLSAKTVSLLVKPEQAERLTLASELGKIRLSLRRPDDTDSGDTDGVSIADLAADHTPPAAKEKDDSAHAASGNSFLDFVKNSATKIKNLEAPTPVDPAPKAAFRSVVFTPEGPTFFEWTDEKSLPHVITSDGQPAHKSKEGSAAEPTAPETPAAPEPKAEGDGSTTEE